MNPQEYAKLKKAFQNYGSSSSTPLMKLPMSQRLEEMYAIAGTTLKAGIFNTPLGHHYDGILRKDVASPGYQFTTAFKK